MELQMPLKTVLSFQLLADLTASHKSKAYIHHQIIADTLELQLYIVREH